jgi:hypothetical protein
MNLAHAVASSRPVAQLCVERVERGGLSRVIKDEELSGLYAYWRARCRPGTLPGRQDIDPLDIPRLLKSILLADVVGPEPRIRYRLVGTAIVQRCGADFTGRYMDESVDEPLRGLLSKLYALVSSMKSAAYCESTLRLDGKRGVPICRLMLPLAADGTTVDLILAGHVFHGLKPRSDPAFDIGRDRDPWHQSAAWIET